jgi:hypothetical protein
MGDRLGFYHALAGAGPLMPAELAEWTGTAGRYVREWLNGRRQAAMSATTPTAAVTPCPRSMRWP